MKWIEARVTFDCPDADLAAELISNIFYDLGLNGVMIEDPIIETVEDWAEGPEEIPDWFAVVGYLPVDKTIQNRIRKLESELSSLSDRIDIHYEIAYDETVEEDWAESWKQFFKPQKITRRLVVKPSWESYTPDTGEIILEIEPGMAFGTGTHPTTCLCLELIEKYLRPGDTFLDVGTGSGILMIAAAKLGASTLTGIDTDPMAVDVARKNLNRNDIPDNRYSVHTGCLIHGIDKFYKMVVSNILSEVILALLNDLRSVLAEEGVFIFSGITQKNLKEVLEKIEAKGLRAIQVSVREEWVAIAGTHKHYSISNSFQSNQ